MPKITEQYNFGNTTNIDMETLLFHLQEMYRDLAVAVNKKPDLYVRTVDGSANESFLSDGDININTTTAKVEMITQHPTQTTVTWTQLS